MRRRSRNELFKKAFTRIAGGSRSGLSYGDARARAEALALVSSPITGEIIEPRLSLSLLEAEIYELAEAGDRKALRDAIREYVYLSLGVSLWR